ncbi:ASKHA domain-containing protein [Candidatus Magnetaquicoccus inordinatus]|uniref:ASKHA domain-containing protein n=1 Tax=Candidatus Magnetaquicoccus inordinatus TaxID=2496818 RepID=UPI00102CFFB5|nr:ASKHA domain-containing protein [Candidatus Magnetaquicoccus inordinatus]
MNALMLTLHAGEKTLHLPIIPGFSIRELLDTTTLRVRAACGGSGRCGACRVRLLTAEAPPCTRSERERLSPQLRQEGWRLACQLRPDHSLALELSNPAPAVPWRSLPVSELQWLRGRLPSMRKTPLGVAIDLGTTHLRITLWDCAAGRRLASRWGVNPQEIHGSDPLNRLDYALHSPERSKEMATQLRQTLLDAVQDMLTREVGGGASHLPHIGRLMIVGNTAMLSLLSGQGAAELLSPDNWQQPIACQPIDRSAWQQEWGLPNAHIILVDPIAGFIGSDLLAGILAFNLLEAPAATLFLDLGTNLELALWDGAVLHVTSVPGGSAFSLLSPDPAAWPGLHEEVTLLHDPLLQQADNANCVQAFSPAALLEAVALLRRQGILKVSGRFAPSVAGDGYQLQAQMLTGRITLRAVDELQRAKAACAAAIAMLLEKARLHWQDLQNIWLSGSLGSRIPLAAAKELGLLPPVADASIHQQAGSALSGCEKLLLAEEYGEILAPVQLRLSPFNLATQPRYEELFITHLRLQPYAASQ